MKLFISCDMEGISGIVDPTYVNPESGENYQRGRQFMTGDLNAVVEAALEFGVTEIVVADSHNEMNNLLLEELHPNVRLLAGSPRDFSMMHGLDSTFAAAMFIGYHTRQGVPGVLSHTMSGAVRNIYINGNVVGEFGFNATYAGLCGVPVCLVSGDHLVAEEAKQFIPQITTAVVKYATSRTSALCLSLEESRQLLKQKTIEALQSLEKVQPVQTKVPMEVTIQFTHAGQAEMAANVPHKSYQPEESSVTYLANDQHEMYRVFRAMLTLAGSVRYF